MTAAAVILLMLTCITAFGYLFSDSSKSSTTSSAVLGGALTTLWAVAVVLAFIQIFIQMSA